MCLYPMLGDVDPSTAPYILMRQNIIEESFQCFYSSALADDSAMQSNGHHPRSFSTLFVEGIEIVFQVSKKLGHQERKDPVEE